MELTIMVLLEMAVVGALSLAIYSRLPRMAFESAQKHSRYSGLGTVDVSDAPTAGKRSVSHLGSLQEQSA